jgi:hypothetical protein
MITCTLATATDDSTLRALLRDNAMPSWVSMSVTREPSYFAGYNRFGKDWAVVAHEDDTVVGMYACSLQQTHLNGDPVEQGYLGALRVVPAYRNRLRILREGFASIRPLAPFRTPEQWYTAIATENYVARRLLEANLRGMPCYRATSDLVTMALPGARGRRRFLWRKALPQELDRLCRFYNRSAEQYQFSPLLTPENAVRTGAAFFVIEREDELLACMALWNQQDYKQVTAHAYRRPMETLLPIYNTYARLARKVCLPRVGETFDQTHLAFLAITPALEAKLPALIEDALAIAPSRVLTLGLHGQHPWLETLIRRFRPALYRTRIYAVNFESSSALDARPAQPEVALL